MKDCYKLFKKDYYKDVIYFTLNSKLSTDIKLKLIFNLDTFLADKREEGKIMYIDEKGFEQFKERIIKEEEKLNK